MPTYPYRCNSCSESWEEVHRISERDVPITEPCPKCGEKTVERFIDYVPPVGDAISLGLKTTSSDFKEVMRRIHKRTPGSQLDKTSTITKI